MNRRTVAWLLALVSALHLTACGGPASGRRSASPGPTRLRVLVLPSLSSAPLFVAAEGGHFAAAGIDVEFVNVTRSSDAILALARGELDVWAGSVSFGLLNALGRGAAIRIVADRGFFAPHGCAYGALVARRSLVDQNQVTRPADLRGRRVALNPNASPGFVVEKLLGRSGLSLDDLVVVDLPEGSVVAEALARGSIDAAFVLEPWLTRIVQAGSASILASAGDAAPDYQHMVTAYGPSLLSGNADVGRRFIAAYLSGVSQYSEGKTERNVASIAKHTGLDADLLRAACWPAVRADGRVDTLSMLEFQQWGVKRGLLDRAALTADQLWDPAFVADAGRARQ